MRGSGGISRLRIWRSPPQAEVAAGASAPPEAHLAWYDAAAVWDLAEGRAWLVGAGWRRPAAAAAAELAGWLDGSEPAPDPGAAPAGPVLGDFTREGYEAAVGEVRNRIAAGEIYQMNLAQRFSCAAPEPPARLYRRLRGLNPAPMAAYVEAGEWTVLSSSPERFIAVERGRIRTFPVKGTRPRGATPAQDATLRRDLAASEKERAELLMIVDLLRNDLGRICRFGSVRVRRLHDLESFATVHHLVGEVEGELRPGVGAAELLRAVFPGGSITGAPKLRAMRVIGELEPVPRGIFSGAIGYWSACGRIDLNIAIRTIVCHRGQASFHVGAGIVWDSDPGLEYEETLAKGRALLAALGGRWPGSARARVGGGSPAPGRPIAGIRNGVWREEGAAEPPDARGVFETVLLAGGKPARFEDHLRRFQAGCAAFGLTDAPGPGALADAAAEAVRRTRLTDGVLRWSAWAEATGETQWHLRVEPPRPHTLKGEWRAALSSLRLPPPGPESACKHLGRRLWRDALVAARAAGSDEALLADAAGRLVEGSMTNIFLVRGGRLLTPALATGPLPGLTRARVLALARRLGLPTEEGLLTPADLGEADEVFLTNSLIGLRPVGWLADRRLPGPGPVTTRLQAAFSSEIR